MFIKSCFASEKRTLSRGPKTGRVLLLLLLMALIVLYVAGELVSRWRFGRNGDAIRFTAATKMDYSYNIGRTRHRCIELREN